MLTSPVIARLRGFAAPPLRHIWPGAARRTRYRTPARIPQLGPGACHRCPGSASIAVDGTRDVQPFAGVRPRETREPRSCHTRAKRVDVALAQLATYW